MSHAEDTYAEYLESVILTQLQYPNWRLGQTAFNVLHEVRPDLAAEIHNTEYDPFYFTDRLPGAADKVFKFLSYIESRWDNAGDDSGDVQATA
jgi:hypothetical protein